MSMGGGHSTTTTTQELSPEQRALIAPVIPIAQNFLAHPPQQWGGSAIAGFNPLQQSAQQMTLNAANAMVPQLGQIPGMINTAQQGFGNAGNVQNQINSMIGGVQKGTNFLTSGDVLKADSNPYLQSAITAATRPIMQNFNEQIMPGLTQDSLGMGGLGGTRQGIAEGIAGRGASQAVGDVSSSMANTNYQAGLQAMLGGLQAAQGQRGDVINAGQLRQQGAAGTAGLAQNMGGILQQQLLPAQLKEAVGTQQQMMQQQLLSEQVQKFVNQQMIPFSAAQDVAAMAFGMPGGTTKSASTGNAGAGGMMQGIGSIAGAIMPLLMKSDRRLKKNIVAIGEENGLTVYSFVYKGTDLKMVGFMADEVEGLYPENVFMDVTGYKSVNYGEMLWSSN